MAQRLDLADLDVAEEGDGDSETSCTVSPDQAASAATNTSQPAAAAPERSVAADAASHAPQEDDLPEATIQLDLSDLDRAEGEHEEATAPVRVAKQEVEHAVQAAPASPGLRGSSEPDASTSPVSLSVHRADGAAAGTPDSPLCAARDGSNNAATGECTGGTCIKADRGTCEDSPTVPGGDCIAVPGSVQQDETTAAGFTALNASEQPGLLFAAEAVAMHAGSGGELAVGDREPAEANSKGLLPEADDRTTAQPTNAVRPALDGTQQASEPQTAAAAGPQSSNGAECISPVIINAPADDQTVQTSNAAGLLETGILGDAGPVAAGDILRRGGAAEVRPCLCAVSPHCRQTVHAPRDRLPRCSGRNRAASTVSLAVRDTSCMATVQRVQHS